MKFIIVFLLQILVALAFPKDKSGIALFSSFKSGASIEILKNISYLKSVRAPISLPSNIGSCYPFVGDWDGDGVDEIGFMENPKKEDWKNTTEFNIKWFLKRNNGYEKIETPFRSYVFEKMRIYSPIAGKWLDDQVDSVGLYYETDPIYLSKERKMCCRPNFYLIRKNSYHHFELPLNCEKYKASFCNGSPIVGDWNGDGKEDVGVFFRGFNHQQLGFWVFVNNIKNPSSSITSLVYGNTISFAMPVSGDWDGDGKDGIGLYYYLPNHIDLWIFINDISDVNDSKILRFGDTHERPLPISGNFFSFTNK